MNTRSYVVVTLSYWGFTLTDGALRMLVLLHFHTLGYTPVQIAFLFLFYEFFGILTNLFGGWLASRTGLKLTLIAGISLQIIALLMLSFLSPQWTVAFSVAYVMASQALSGIAKDLTKMSSKSSLKVMVPEGQDTLLFRWVAFLTGSKNALKGVGFFLGGFLLAIAGFVSSLFIMAGALAILLLVVLFFLPREMGRAKGKTPFKELFSKDRRINILSAARFFLFCSRDVWFVVGVPIFLTSQLGWSFEKTGGFLALWVIGYGVVQFSAPVIFRKRKLKPTSRDAAYWCFSLAFIPFLIVVMNDLEMKASTVIIGGLAVFGFFFAVNSAVHSFLILDYSDGDKVALNVGFYYMANAGGRLLGTLLSGLLYQFAGLEACLLTSGIFLLSSATIALFISHKKESHIESNRLKPERN